MKLHLTVETHRDKAGNHVAQLLLGGRVVWEEDAPYENQAIDNVVTALSGFLTESMQADHDRLMAEIDAE